jgi:hypothetical protein
MYQSCFISGCVCYSIYHALHILPQIYDLMFHNVYFHVLVTRHRVGIDCLLCVTTNNYSTSINLHSTNNYSTHYCLSWSAVSSLVVTW